MRAPTGGRSPGRRRSCPTSLRYLKEKKVAIVIGISDYPVESGFPKLQFAAKDAQDLAAALEKQGYQVQLLTDQHAMKSSLKRALEQAQVTLLNQSRADSSDGGTMLFAFSGHGGETAAGGEQSKTVSGDLRRNLGRHRPGLSAEGRYGCPAKIRGHAPDDVYRRVPR